MEKRDLIVVDGYGKSPIHRNFIVPILIAIALIAIAFMLYPITNKDKLAEFDRINVSPMTYLLSQGFNRNFKPFLSKEVQDRLNDKSLGIVMQKKILDRYEIVGKAKKDYVAVCIDKSCTVFSQNIFSKHRLDNVIDNIDSVN